MSKYKNRSRGRGAGKHIFSNNKNRKNNAHAAMCRAANLVKDLPGPKRGAAETGVLALIPLGGGSVEVREGR